jgi:hypothetical protein
MGGVHRVVLLIFRPDLLAEVLALEHAQEGLRRGFQALRHRLARPQLAGAHQRAEFLQRLGPDFHVLADDEALQRRRLVRSSCG